MLALKKEAVLWAQTIEKDYDENWNFFYRIPWFLSGSVANLVKWAEKLWDWEVWAWTQYLLSAWLWTWAVIRASWKIIWGTKWQLISRTWAYIATVPFSCVYSLWKKAARNTRCRCPSWARRCAMPCGSCIWPTMWRWETATSGCTIATRCWWHPNGRPVR